MTTCERRRAKGGWWEDLALKRCTFPIAPRNTWSNLAYPLVASVLVLLDGSAASWAMAVALTVLGVGSGLYHGLKTSWANKLDWLGMYAVFAALGTHGMMPHDPHVWLVMLLATFVVGYVFTYVFRQVGANMLIGLLLVLAGVPPAFTGAWPWVLASLGCFLLAKACWVLDRRRHVVVGLWGHALWHILTADAFGLMYWAQRQS